MSEPLVQHGGTDQPNLKVPAVGPPCQELLDDGLIGGATALAHAARDHEVAPDELAEGGFLHLGVHLVEVANPFLQPPFSDLAVTRLETALPANTAQLLAGVVPAATSVTIQTGEVGHLDVGGRTSNGGSEDVDHERGRKRMEEGVGSPRSSLRLPSCRHFARWQAMRLLHQTILQMFAPK